MNRADKMNVLYKIGFILLCVCIGLFAASVTVMLVFEKIKLGVLLAIAGVVLCLVAIILTMFSKPKAPGKRRKRRKAAAEEIEDTAEPALPEAPADEISEDI